MMLVEDEGWMQKLVLFRLEKEGYRVVQARDGEEALKRFEEHPIDLVVLDVMMPRMDGLEVCRRLRPTSAVPIIMLTARDEEVDKVLGLELGADDYITKPFSVRELAARVRALLRRAYGDYAPSGLASTIVRGDLIVDVERRRVTRAGRPVELTATEFE